MGIKEIYKIIQNILKKMLKIFKLYLANTFIMTIIFIIVGFIFGFFYAKSMDKINYVYLILGSGIVIFLMLYIYLVLNKKFTPNKLKERMVKNIYYAVSFLCFIIYYLCNKDRFLSTYSKNKIGINQEQFIILVNFIGYILIASLVYMLVFKNYIIKKLGRDGVEFENDDANVSDKFYNVINRYEEMINSYTNNLLTIDAQMNALYEEGKVNLEYTANQYCSFITTFLKDFINELDDISIVVKPFSDFENFLKEFANCNIFDIKKIKTKVETNNVFSYKKRIYIYYKSSLISEPITVIVDMEDLKYDYPGDLGFLIYNYIYSVEVTYSKYLV